MFRRNDSPSQSERGEGPKGCHGQSLCWEQSKRGLLCWGSRNEDDCGRASEGSIALVRLNPPGYVTGPWSSWDRQEESYEQVPAAECPAHTASQRRVKISLPAEQSSKNSKETLQMSGRRFSNSVWNLCQLPLVLPLILPNVILRGAYWERWNIESLSVLTKM